MTQICLLAILTITMAKITTSTQLNSSIGGKSDRYNWHLFGKQYPIVYETIGQGNPVLLLPALSEEWG